MKSYQSRSKPLKKWDVVPGWCQEPQLLSDHVHAARSPATRATSRAGLPLARLFSTAQQSISTKILLRLKSESTKFHRQPPFDNLKMPTHLSKTRKQYVSILLSRERRVGEEDGGSWNWIARWRNSMQSRQRGTAREIGDLADSDMAGIRKREGIYWHSR